jgi:WD40 repeat protein
LLSLELISVIPNISEECHPFGISPDSQYLAVASHSQPDTVQIRNFQGKVFKQFQGHKGNVYSVCFSGDGRTIASASADKSVRIWSPTGELYTLFDRFDSGVSVVQFAIDVPILAAGEISGLIVLFDIAGNYIATLHSPKAQILDLAWSKDSSLLAASCADSNLYLYQISEQLKKTYQHPGPVYGAVFSLSNGQTTGSWKMISGCEDGIVRYFDLDNDTINPISAHKGPIVSIAVSGDGTLIATASLDKTVILSDRHGNPKGRIELPNDPLSVKLSNNGSHLYAIVRPHELHIFKIIDQNVK